MSETSYDLLDDLPADLPPLAVALGVFDGVHRGHQALLAEAVASGRTVGAVPAALTFDPHPAAVFAPARVPDLLTTVAQRAELLHACGARRVVVVPFDRAFAAQTPDEFARVVLVEKLRARVVVVGDDFQYGCNRTGTVTTLRAAGETHGFTVRVVPPQLQDGIPIRSSVLRGMIAGGAVEEAHRLLGRPYALSGTVVRGHQLGRALGFPTANLAPPLGILVPGAGVYAGRAHVGGSSCRAAISIGTNPTVVDAGARTVEAFLLDGFAADIYGETLTLEFLHYLRAHVKFPDLETLIAQMNHDVAETQRRIR